jgi:hypothetical protein
MRLISWTHPHGTETKIVLFLKYSLPHSMIGKIVHVHNKTFT